MDLLLSELRSAGSIPIKVSPHDPFLKEGSPRPLTQRGKTLFASKVILSVTLLFLNINNDNSLWHYLVTRIAQEREFSLLGPAPDYTILPLSTYSKIRQQILVFLW